MSHKLTLAGAVAAATLSLISTQPSEAQNRGCENSARYMSDSCRFEAREDYNETLARCASVNDAAERTDCRAAALESRGESLRECRAQRTARVDTCDVLDERRYIDPLTDDTIMFVNPDDVGEGRLYPNNPYVIIEAGHTFVLRAEEPGDSDDEEQPDVEVIVVHVTDEVREIEGVSCRVVLDVVLEPSFDEEEGEFEFEPIEVTDDWFAQDTEQNVYYCGEIARNFEDGVLRDLDGSFEAGLDRAEGGLLIAAAPVPGEVHRQEYAIGEAEDLVQYLTTSGTPQDEGIADNPDFPCGVSGSGNCLQTFEFTPLEPDSGEYKYYMEGVGFVLAIPLEEGEPVENNSERLICSGNSLEVLSTPACGFNAEEVEELLGTLCDLADEFCDDGE